MPIFELPRRRLVYPRRPAAIYNHRDKLSGAVPESVTRFQMSLSYSEHQVERVSEAVLLFAVINNTARASQFFYDDIENLEGIEKGKLMRERETFGLVQDLYLEGDDERLTYDAATTAALAGDPEYQQLLEQPQPPSEFAVDQLRMHRLTFFLDRVISYHADGGRDQVLYTV